MELLDDRDIEVRGKQVYRYVPAPCGKKIRVIVYERARIRIARPTTIPRPAPTAIRFLTTTHSVWRYLLPSATTAFLACTETDRTFRV
jgi:hypothetical protein